ncbi:LacI family DNA-binding transcriptional regulator [Nocardioides panaciterrulae]|uniref:LacI family transcriptional regulator n=1 Tax=Nocardioides panaciterrulae TaxID=661492 RepID=A0A7Y9JBL4_9ACTN|nr:LacI family DNA-binding transcriptional regulator [Nocardioides panaciterrulae]NYD42922.1 LacI family transcriptional regulator [Nocardioides panaciterrulae]
MRSHKVTLSDVARRAGVSSTTASYILNGRSAQMRISPETEQRVRAAVAALGYRPNRSARNLRKATTETIGLISDFVAGGQFASQMLTGASAAARAADHLLLIGETGGDAEVERLLVEEMIDRQVDGLVYAKVVTSQIAVPAALAGQRRVVLLNCVDPASPTPAVLPDETMGGRAAARAVLDAGVAGDIWLVGQDPDPHATAGPQRLAGVREELAGSGHPLAGVLPCDWSVQESFRAVSSWLDLGGRPGALVCLNDRIGMGAYQALEAHGLVVPRDVVVVSFDGSALAGWLRPRLASVAIPYAELGALAVRTVLDPEGPGVGVRLVPMALQAGESAPPVGRRPLAGAGAGA